MNDDTRWKQLPTPSPTGPWPDLRGQRIRNIIGRDGFLERLEVEAQGLPTKPGWYRFPDEFGVVFRRDDGTWLDVKGSRVSEASLPDGLIPLVDEQ